MSHQPFEAWILEKNTLNPDQVFELNTHLESCTQCTQLQEGMQAMEFRFKNTAMVAPSKGFTQRFQVRLAERLELQRLLQVRRFFLFLAGATGLVFLVLVAIFLIAGSPVTWLGTILESVTNLFLFGSQVGKVLISLYFALPPSIPIALWVILTSAICFLALIWATALWRISIKGVVQQ
jgi:hypothetical protein